MPQKWVDAVTTAADRRTARQLLQHFEHLNKKAKSSAQQQHDVVTCLKAQLYLAEVFWQDAPLRMHSGAAPFRLSAVQEITLTNEFQAFAMRALVEEGSPAQLAASPAPVAHATPMPVWWEGAVHARAF